MTTLPPPSPVPSTMTGRVLAVFGPLFFSGSLPHDSEDTRLRKAQLSPALTRRTRSRSTS